MKKLLPLLLWTIGLILVTAATASATDIDARLSLRFYRIDDRMKYTDFKAHGIGIRVSLREILNTGFNFYVRYRSGKTPNYYSVSRTKLYDLTLSHDHIIGNLGFAVGRLNTPVVGAYGILDGFKIQYQWANHYYIGGFWGTEPDLLTYEMKDEIKRTGLFAYIDWGRSYQGNFSVIRQTYLDRLDRFFLFVDNEIDFSDSWSFGQFAEIDLIEKEGETGEHQTFQFTDVFTDLRFRPGNRFTATLTYTTHKEFKYLESMSDIPDSLFENSVDQSVGLRLNVRPFKNWRLYSRLRYGVNSEESGEERYLAVGAAHYNFLFTKIFLTGRYARNDGFYARSNSWYVSAERAFWNKFRASVAYRKADIEYKLSSSQFSNTAVDVAFTYNLSWRFYLFLKASRLQGDDRNETRLFLELNYKIRSYKEKPRP